MDLNFFEIVAIIIILYIIGITMLWYLNDNRCHKHEYETIHRFDLNSKSGVYLRTIYHQQCKNCKAMRKYNFSGD